jgi:hypothetical protein
MTWLTCRLVADRAGWLWEAECNRHGPLDFPDSILDHACEVHRLTQGAAVDLLVGAIREARAGDRERQMAMSEVAA